jgi:predicted RNA-binding protein YlqC (UPF0109 family)
MTSNTLKTRMNNHLSNIRNWKNTSVARHFVEADHQISTDFKIGIIDRSNNDIESLKIREGYWISALRTVMDGINEREESNLSMDYQVVMHAKHFNHSKSCLPYTTNYLQQVRTLNLNNYRRIILNPSRNSTASALPTRTADQSRAANSILRFWTQNVTLQRERK